MALVTVLSPPITNEPAEFVIQMTVGARFVVDSKLKTPILIGQVKITLVPMSFMANRGCGRVKLNNVPLPKLPPLALP